MMKSVQTLMVVGSLWAVQAHAASESYSDPVIQALDEGKVLVDMRVRYETVDNSIDDDAKALTVRTRLGYQTGAIAGFRLLAEMTDTRTLFGLDDYWPESPGYATIADPSNTELNRLLLSYENFDNLWLGLGRQRIILDNARWVGNVGWRQKEQTFDALSADWDLTSDLRLSYDFVQRVQGVTPAFDADVSNHFINLAYGGWDAGKLVGYAYLLEDDDTDDENNTVGLRFSGERKTDPLTWGYSAEYAYQRVDFDSGDDFSTHYYALTGSAAQGPLKVVLGYEVLGSDGGDYGLQTPLATKHAFNGWADVFLLGTPDDGLRDVWIDASVKWLGLKWGAVYHDFSADEGSDDYGREVDLLLVKKFNAHYLLGLKFADYNARDFSEDRQMLALWFDFKY